MSSNLVNILAEYIREVSKPFRTRLVGLGIAEQEFAPHFERIVELSFADLAALVKNDPAAHGSPEYVWDSYGSIKAVVNYRTAHEIQSFAPESEFASVFSTIARKLSEEAKRHFGIEIHPQASIGAGFIVDHGLGTVVGETAVLGRNCVLLQGVVLGATGTSIMTPGRRHPKLGDGVTVCSFAKVLGPIEIGSYSFIGPECIVLQSLPERTQVKRIHASQVIKSTGSVAPFRNAEVYAVVPKGNGECCIYGRYLNGLVPRIVNRDEPTIDIVNFRFSSSSTEISIFNAKRISDTQYSRPILILNQTSNGEHWIHDSLGLERFYSEL